MLADLLKLPLRSAGERGGQTFLEAALAAEASGDLNAARGHLERGLAAQGGKGRDAWLALGRVLMRQADVQKALLCYRRAAEEDPSSLEATLGVGRALRAAGDLEGATSALRRVYAAHAADPAVLRELVSTLIEADHCERALAIATEAAARQPDSFEVLTLLGKARLKVHDAQGALEALQAAGKLRADDAELHDLRGSACQELGRLGEARAAYDRALALQPGMRLARFHRGLLDLLEGNFEQGWEGYALRMPPPGLQDGDPHEWRGTPLGAGTLLVRREQGLGDEIMFASILPELKTRAQRVFVECDIRLRGLFSRSFPEATFFGSLPGGELPHAVTSAGIDATVRAGSLPRLFRRRPADFPRHDGYLKADPRRIDDWRARLDAIGPGLKVGLSWIGGVRQTRRALRSLPLAGLGQLLGTRGAHFVSLQYTQGAAEEAESLRASTGIAIHHWPDAIADYDETAALVCALDLVISVCTSIVHLGGALGRPVWVMAPYSPEWRYGFSGDAMPWYPSVRLFRQPRYGDWPAVIASVSGELRSVASQRVS
jgi:Flp pilus assembly protein TadD